MKTKLLSSLFLMGLILLSGLIDAQNVIVTNMGNYTATVGQQINVPVKAAQFTDISVFSITILWDPAVLSYNGNTSWDAALNAGAYLCNSPVPGKFIGSWYIMSPLTIPDSALLANLQFTYLGGATVLVFDTAATDMCEFADEMGNSLPVTFVNGSVNWPGYNPVCSNSISYTTVQNMGVILTGTTVNSSPIYNYYWTFGDGHSKLTTNNNVYHGYNTAGTYTVTLEAREFDFCISTSSLQVTVFSPSIDGNITALAALDTGKIDLYRWDDSGNSFNLYDSLHVNATYNFPNIAQGNYIVKATPATTSTYASTYLPTYYGDTPFWTSASMIYSFQMFGPYNINLVQIVSPAPGPGIIGGTINNSLKILNSGIPAPGIEILLTNTADEVQAVCYSNSNGAFEFNNLAYGTYKLRAEKTSVLSYPLTLTLSAANSNINNINFEITPAGIITGTPEVTTASPFSLGTVFPNPATDRLMFEIKSIHETKATIEVYNMLGQRIISQTERIGSGNKTITLNTEILKGGPYYLCLITPDGKILRQSFTICR